MTTPPHTPYPAAAVSHHYHQVLISFVLLDWISGARGAHGKRHGGVLDGARYRRTQVFVAAAVSRYGYRRSHGDCEHVSVGVASSDAAHVVLWISLPRGLCVRVVCVENVCARAYACT